MWKCADPQLEWQIRCFPYGERSDVPRLQQVEQKAVRWQRNLRLWQCRIVVQQFLHLTTPIHIPLVCLCEEISKFNTLQYWLLVEHDYQASKQKIINFVLYLNLIKEWSVLLRYLLWYFWNFDMFVGFGVYFWKQILYL